MSARLQVRTCPPESPDERDRDTSRPIILIGFREQENLGLGYLASMARKYGYRVEIFDFQEDPATILEAARAMQPILIGLSLIFQFYIDRFGTLVRYLRDHGIDAHFTMGGHFPSLSYKPTLELIPELDSVVRFEGELTLLELLDCLGTGREWRGIAGIAYHDDTDVVATPSRRLVEDLDRCRIPRGS